MIDRSKPYFLLQPVQTFSGSILNNITDDFGNVIQVCMLAHVSYMARRYHFRGWVD